jgi:GAF domain-containing protein
VREEYRKSVELWLEEARKIAPSVVQWIGIYYRASYLLGEDSTDLVLGPYIGPETEHTRIPLDRGMCGLALRENRVVNVDDVREDARHIACSLTTRSELVIPLYDQKGDSVAELDVDSDTLKAFTPELEARFKAFSKSFPLL